MVVVALFLGALFDFHLSVIIAILFIVAMLSFIGGLTLFLREVFVATRTLRIGLRAGRHARQLADRAPVHLHARRGAACFPLHRSQVVQMAAHLRPRC